jgi:hypothetical protein
MPAGFYRRDRDAVLRGSLDALTAQGYLIGWAYDDDDPHEPVAVSAWANGHEVAAGLANRFRADLVEAGRGNGWCAFCLRLSTPPADMLTAPVILRRRGDGADIVSAEGFDLLDDRDARLTSIDRVLDDDPTIVTAIEALRGCGSMFEDAIVEWGVERFIQVAFNYVLDRPADDEDTASLAAALRGGDLTPYGLLKRLHERPEFRSSPRPLIAPTEPGFPFRRS